MQAQASSDAVQLCYHFDRSCNSTRQGQWWDISNNQNDRKRRNSSQGSTAFTDFTLEHAASRSRSSHLSDNSYSANESMQSFVRCNKRLKCEAGGAAADTAVKRIPDAHIVNIQDTHIKANPHSISHASSTPESSSACSSPCSSEHSTRLSMNLAVSSRKVSVGSEVTSSRACAQSQPGLISDMCADLSLPSLLEYAYQTWYRAHNTDCADEPCCSAESEEDSELGAASCWPSCLSESSDATPSPPLSSDDFCSYDGSPSSHDGPLHLPWFRTNFGSEQTVAPTDPHNVLPNIFHRQVCQLHRPEGPTVHAPLGFISMGCEIVPVLMSGACRYREHHCR